MHHHLKPLCALLVLAAGQARAESQPRSATIEVKAGTALGKVNPWIFGQNIETADAVGIFVQGERDPKFLRTGDGVWDPSKKQPVEEVVKAFKEVGTSMIRYPGGCLAHNYDWRKAVGPLAERGDWLFGIDEYIQLCRDVGAEPIVTVSDYVLPAAEMPQHAADLVEYLNAPADGKHPWADKRKQWGHPEPYGVKFFELGNESDHGNHQVKPSRKFTPEEYAKYAINCAKAMKAVDPKIKVGIVTVPGSAQDVSCAWNETILAEAGKAADFVVVHLYAPSIYPGFTTENEVRLLNGCMALSEQMEHNLKAYSKLILDKAGRELPIAITEFNVNFTADAPKPYRYSFAAALQTADLLRTFLDPKLNIMSASYWQILNGWWGMLHLEEGTPRSERPAFALYKLWSEHFGTELVEAKVNGPKANYEGGNGVRRAQGDKIIDEPLSAPLSILGGIDTESLNSKGLSASRETDGSLVLTFNNFTDSAYTKLKTVEHVQKGMNSGSVYRVSYQAKYIPETGSVPVALGLGLGDSRGWDATKSAIDASRVFSEEWQTVTADYESLPDASGIEVLLRLVTGTRALNGKLHIKDVEISEKPAISFPAYNLITATASLSKDRKTLYLVVFNKSDSEEIETTIRLEDFAAAGGASWTVGAKDFLAFQAEEVAQDSNLAVVDKTITKRLPAHSMTAMEFQRTE